MRIFEEEKNCFLQLHLAFLKYLGDIFSKAEIWKDLTLLEMWDKNKNILPTVCRDIWDNRNP